MEQKTTNPSPKAWEWSEELGPFADRIRQAFPAVQPSSAFERALKGQLLRTADRDRPFITPAPDSVRTPLLWGLASFLLLGLFLYRWLKRGRIDSGRMCPGVPTTS